MQLLQPDLFGGAPVVIKRPARRKRGSVARIPTMDRAAGVALAAALDSADEAWRDMVVAIMRMWCRERKAAGQAEFRIEQFRAWASGQGLPAPAGHHAWGSVPAMSKELIKPTDRFERAESVRTRGHRVMVYRAI